MVRVDIYVNETTRHADVILPAPSPLERSHYDLAFYQLSVRNIANYSPPVLDARPGVARRVGDAAAARGDRRRAAGADADVEPLDRLVAGELLRRETADAHSPVHGRDVEELLARARAAPRPRAAARHPAARGPYGDGFGARPTG